jgi:hypothetical protein
MSTWVNMQRKPQQQTLSIRIPDELREFLEHSQQVISNGGGEPVSISEIAKSLLESAKDDRSEFRLEAAGLMLAPTESLCRIRRKWEYKQALSRAEWILLGHYIQAACEELSENPALPSPSAFAIVLEALLAVRSLRSDRGVGLDRYYLGNLGFQDGIGFNERQFDPQIVPRVVETLIQEIREASAAKKPVFAGRSLYVALRDEVMPDLVGMNDALEPFLAPLFRLAARGHWLREHRPVRNATKLCLDGWHNPAQTRGTVSLTVCTDTAGDLRMLLTMDGRGLRYPIRPYPEIQEFSAMLHHLEPERPWSGVHFHASADRASSDRPARFHFWRPSDQVTLSFGKEEWDCLKELFSTALEELGLQPVLSALTLEYGEL